MSVDSTIPADDDMDEQPDTDVPAPTVEPEPVSTATALGYVILLLALVGWFLFGALVQRQGLVNSAGESLGAAFAALVAVSVVAAVRRSRR